MGLIASRPEEPSEWAGIPSEPRDAGSPAEHLAAPVGIGIDALFGSAVSSVAVPLEAGAPEEDPAPAEDADDHD